MNSKISFQSRYLHALVLTLAGFSQTSAAQSVFDEQRASDVATTISALESFAKQSGSFKLSDSGSNNGGQGWFHYERGSYDKSISSRLAELGFLSTPLPIDPLLANPGSDTLYDFRVHRCQDRIAVFSIADELEPSASDERWWNSNGCSTAAIDRHDLTYFAVSRPLADVESDSQPTINDQIRANELARIIGGFEEYALELNTFRVDGSGSANGGQGWFHFNGRNYDNSISDRLTDLGFLTTPSPADPLLTAPGSFSQYDFRVQRCSDRVAVFSKADQLQPSTADLDWWTDNNCSTSAIDKHGLSYFVLSSPLRESDFPPSAITSDYDLVFNDEFNGTELDPSKWDTALLWGPYFAINNEEQLYVDTLGMHSRERHSPFEFTGTTLKINATAVSDSLPVPARPDFYNSDGSRNPIWSPNDYSEYRFNGPTTDDNGNSFPGFQEEDVNYLSGIITSYDSFKMTHGYVETRAKVPEGRGLWPAFWLLTTHYVEDVPEIDVMEFLGQDVDRLYNTYHYFDVEDDYRKISTPSFRVYAEDDDNNDWTQDFHIFGMAWSPNEIIWYVDGEETHRITDSEYVIANQAMYLIANLAVGGNWPGPPNARTEFPATFEIDYIRAYERKLESELNLSQDYKLQFSDDFDGNTLDSEKWNTHLLWGPYLTINREEQYYVDALGSDADDTTRANTPFVIDDGVLSITARSEDDPNSFPIPQRLPGLNNSIWRDFRSFSRNEGYAPENLNYTSGIITSYDAFKFAYGYAEARMRLPRGHGLWPAFWLLNGYYVGEQPEIDIVEARGGAPDLISHNFHTFNGELNPSDSVSQHPDPRLGYTDGFHRYGVRWQPGRIDWYIDREIVHTYISQDEAPVPYQNMYVLANLATGGDFFVHPNDPYVSPLRPNSIPASLDIDYIRVWQERHKE